MIRYVLSTLARAVVLMVLFSAAYVVLSYAVHGYVRW